MSVNLRTMLDLLSAENIPADAAIIKMKPRINLGDLLSPETGEKFNLDSNRGSLYLVPRPGYNSKPNPNAKRDQNMVGAANMVAKLIPASIEGLSKEQLNQLELNLSTMAKRMITHATPEAAEKIEKAMNVALDAINPPKKSYFKPIARTMIVAGLTALYIWG